MKRCSYCGRKNPDDATVCIVDGKPFEPDAPVAVAKASRSKPPRPKPSREEVLAHLSARPWEVKFGVGLLALDLGVEIISEIIHWWPYRRFLKSHYLDPYYIGYTIGLVCCFWMYAFLFKCIYRGKNWARWLMGCYFVLANISIPFMYRGSLRWDFYLHAVIEFLAIVALFQQSPNNWFKARKKIWNQPAPAT